MTAQKLIERANEVISENTEKERELLRVDTQLDMVNKEIAEAFKNMLEEHGIKSHPELLEEIQKTHNDLEERIEE